jgi:hypothetical protein
MNMNRRTMLATLASAALIPPARLLAKPHFHLPVHHSCDKQLADTITALERASWQANVNRDVATNDAIYADGYFEVLYTGEVFFKEGILEDLAACPPGTYGSFEMSDINVIPMNESAALIRYKVDLVYDGELYHLMVTSSYAKIRGRWQCCSYQEANLDSA